MSTKKYLNRHFYQFLGFL